MKKAVLVVIALTVFLVGCGGAAEEALDAAALAPTTEPEAASRVEAPPLKITSPAFAPGEAIPAKFTCDGDDISPPLQWDKPPRGTQSLVLIMDDPDAPVGTWVHWVVFNLPPDTPGLPENATELPKGSGIGQNSWSRLGYGGPCPPKDTHRYFFKLYAVDERFDLPNGASKDQLLGLMEGRILAQGELMGTYTRQ
jgi:Raf kinase inhibitor-like YbhB/YbcL family protein